MSDGPDERRDKGSIYEKAPEKKAKPPVKKKAAWKPRVIQGGPDSDGDGESRFVRSFDKTDTGNAERLAHHFGEIIRYVPAWGEHIVFDKGRWKRDTGDVIVGRFGKETIQRIAMEAAIEDEGGKKGYTKWQIKSYSRNGRSSMLALLRNEEGIALEHEELDTNPWLLSLQNGTLDLSRKAPKLFTPEHSPKDYITHMLPIAYNPKAKAPRWQKFLKEVIPDPGIRDFVHRYAGYCLTGDVTERVFVIFHGDGQNGKSVFVKALESVMGKYAISAAPTLVTSTEKEAHPTEVADLFRVRLASISETRKGASFNEERIKRLSGDDRLRARRMHEDHWEFEPTHKLLLLMNHKPRVRDTTNSFWDRCRIVPFNERIEKTDKMLKFKLREEREGILLWLLEGLKLWQEQGLKVPEAIKQATREYREEEDIVARFLEECVAVDKKGVESSKDLMAINKIWCEEQNYQYPSSAKELAEKLRRDPYNSETVKSNGNMVWRGIRLLKKVKLK